LIGYVFLQAFCVLTVSFYLNIGVKTARLGMRNFSFLAQLAVNEVASHFCLKFYVFKVTIVNSLLGILSVNKERMAALLNQLLDYYFYIFTLSYKVS
jgi:hypothetical protein